MATTNRGAQQRPLRTCRSIGRRDGRQRTDRCKLLVPERKYEKGIGTPHTTLSGSLRGQCSWVCCTLTARVRFVLLYSPCILMRQRTAFCKPLPYGFTVCLHTPRRENYDARWLRWRCQRTGRGSRVVGALVCPPEVPGRRTDAGAPSALRRAGLRTTPVRRIYN